MGASQVLEQGRVGSSLSSVYCVEGKCSETGGRWQGLNAKGQDKARKNIWHGKVLGKEQGKAW